MGSEHHVRYQGMPDANWHGSMDQMKQILNATDPGAVTDAGQAYSAASTKFYDTRELLRRELPKLREAWTGKVAEEAIGKLEQLWRQADTMRTTSYSIAQSLTDHGEKLEWYKANQPGPGMFDGVDWGDVAAFSFGGLVGLGAKKLFMEDTEDKAATEFMTRLSGRTIEANNLMPVSVTDDSPKFSGDMTDIYPPPPPPPPVGPGTGPGGGGSNGGLPSFQDSGLGSGAGGGGGSNPKVPSLPSSDPYGNGGAGSGSGGAGNGNLPNGIGGVGSDGGGSGSGRLPSGVGGIGSGGGGGGIGSGGIGSGLPDGLGNSDPFGSQGSRLASATPNLPGGGLDGLGSGGGGAGGGMSGFGGGGSGGGVGGGSGLASNGLGPGGAMGAGAGAGRGFGGSGTAAGTGRGAGAPMGGGGGGGRGEEERERSTWLTEDEDVWGGDADTAPPVIG
jgi:hypothetical protein